MLAGKEKQVAENKSESKGKEEKLDGEIQKLMDSSKELPKKKRRFKKRWILIPLIILALVFFVMRILGGANKGGFPVVTDELKKGDVRNVLTLSGPVSGTDSADVTSGLHAQVTELYVKEGDKVEKGQALAKLNPHDVEQALALAENQVELAKANREEALKNAQSSYAKAAQALQSAQADYNRKAELYQGGDISQADFEQAQSALKDASAAMQAFTVKGGKVSVGDSYDIQIQNAEKELEKAKDKINDTTLTSPISGTVTRVNTKVGQFADSQENQKRSLFTIENLDTLELEIGVSEYTIGKISVGQKATIRADIMGDKTAEGEVVSISPSGELKSEGGTERVIPTKIRIDGAASGLISGITAKADILLEEAKDSYVVPISALISQDDGGSAIAFVKDGIVHFSPVNTGVESDISVAVSPKNADDPYFAEGSHYITTPDSNITDGMPVREASVTDLPSSGGAAASAASNAESSASSGAGGSSGAAAGTGSESAAE
ncbi:efflux transporter, RND family, MFP subunit [Oribacterium sp. oral taxon 078 str. F0263]|uniref:efflux RND transporter periplasmic adaptor subunit n=1 Tax=Oribacterium sp. oral taxon 078 TaxID=652706 RepID=UPI0001BCC0BE|nr:efflux RND transporter periplasmic adaptor subunit [Oribacterium sp. oral taxon 078]EFE91959.1 efflux transporter, RND family, MFP subunit [Oribacterium sp. oral taxon 078 str. F0262]ERL22928.1 efflux transporter, RND family, MFP subunit [Oribacterium sp. oral taxon 078 str. F0263]